jgi:hypothetical protein
MLQLVRVVFPHLLVIQTMKDLWIEQHDETVDA